MKTLDFKIIEQLDKVDQEKITYFVKILLKKSKYEKLKKEISTRRDEIAKGKILNHDEIWNEIMDV